MDSLHLALVAGVIVIIGGLGKIVRSRRLTERARGVVVSRRGSQPVFRFTVPGHGEIEVRSDVGHSWAPRAGMEVGVLYDPDDPHRARIDRWDLSGAAAGAFLVAVGLALVAGALLA
jgi:hypothetical protein